MLRRLRKPLLYVLSVSMIWIGALHFVNPAPFARIVPPMFGDAMFIVYLSGVFEVLGGVGLLVPRTRRMAAWGLIALYVAVFPANLYMAWHGIQLFPEEPMPTWAAWARLPFQLVFIVWAYVFTKKVPTELPKSHTP